MDDSIAPLFCTCRRLSLYAVTLRLMQEHCCGMYACMLDYATRPTLPLRPRPPTRRLTHTCTGMQTGSTSIIAGARGLKLNRSILLISVRAKHFEGPAFQAPTAIGGNATAPDLSTPTTRSPHRAAHWTKVATLLVPALLYAMKPPPQTLSNSPPFIIGRTLRNAMVRFTSDFCR